MPHVLQFISLALSEGFMRLNLCLGDLIQICTNRALRSLLVAPSIATSRVFALHYWCSLAPGLHSSLGSSIWHPCLMPLPPVLQQSQQQRHLLPSGGGLPALCKRQGATQSPLEPPGKIYLLYSVFIPLFSCLIHCVASTSLHDP